MQGTAHAGCFPRAFPPSSIDARVRHPSFSSRWLRRRRTFEVGRVGTRALVLSRSFVFIAKGRFVDYNPPIRPALS